MLTFDRKQMVDQIEPLPKRLRIAFAVACAQRHLPKSIRTSSANLVRNPQSMLGILRDLWGGVERNAFNPEKLRHDLTVCEVLVGEYEGRPNFVDSEIDEEAVFSVIHSLDAALTGHSQDAVFAAENARDALDGYIIQSFGVDPNAPGANSLINSFPIMQAELSRQQADLAELRVAAKEPGIEAAVIARIKHRAERDAASFFG